MNTTIKAAPQIKAVTGKATSNNRDYILAGLTVTDKCLIQLLQAGSCGLISPDLARQDSSCLFWTDRLSLHISQLRSRFIIHGKPEPVLLPDCWESRRTRYRLKDKAEAIKAVDYLNAGRCVINPAESARLIALFREE